MKIPEWDKLKKKNNGKKTFELRLPYLTLPPITAGDHSITTAVFVSILFFQAEAGGGDRGGGKQENKEDRMLGQKEEEEARLKK